MRPRLIVALVFAGALILSASVAVGFLIHGANVHRERRQEASIARKAALVNYRNSLIGCQRRGNETRENQLSLAIKIGDADVVYKIRHAPHSRHDGSIICKEAIERP